MTSTVRERKSGEAGVNVAAWLNRLGLEQYEQAVRENDVDAEVLPELTAEDLIGLGVTSIGHRRKLLAAIAALREKPAPADEKTAPIKAPNPAEDPAGLSVSTAERRQLTVMFCDLVGSTQLSTRLDPEDLREVIGAYHHAIAEIVTGFGGFVSRFMGDGVLIYFGFPQAHEDDAERAVRAGLGAIDAVRRLDVKSVKLQTRVAIATGLVVVGDLIGAGPAQEQSVVGETPNLAARLQALASPDAVVIAAGTRRLVGNLFEYRDLGAVEVKGFTAPVRVWQVLRPSGIESRFEALRGSALGALVGRDKDIHLLLRHWARVKASEGQVVLISGEPGIGKSRLIAAFEACLRAEPHLRLRYFCSPYHQDSALFPFIDQLGRSAGFAPDDPAAGKSRKLEILLASIGLPDEDVAFLGDLLSLPASERYPLLRLSPQRKKERTLEALIRYLERIARQQPALMVFEDAQWADATSRELLGLAVESVRELPVLLIATFRTEFQPPWTGQPHVTMLVLNRLNRRDRRTLVGQIVGAKLFPREVIDQIADRTDGVPLFVEELTKTVLESGLLREESDRYVLDRALPPVAIPTTLHASLLARLDRFAPVRRVAQTGAAIGREFSYTLLRAVSPLPDEELQSALTRLVASELVFQRGTLPGAVYSFKHALVQDAAHDSLLRSARQQLHSSIAETLETHFPEMMESQPELFAQHYAEAGLVEKSVTFWGKAAHRSAARSAMTEAAVQFQKGLDQLILLPESPERHRQELKFSAALGAALIAVKGFAAPETVHVHARARKLWEQLGSPSEFFQLLYNQSMYHVIRGELALAQHSAEDLLRLSLQRNDRGGLLLGHFACGRNLILVGRLASSRRHLEEALSLCGPIARRSLVHKSGIHPTIHPGINSQSFLGIVLFCLGFPDQALVQNNAAIAGARRLADPPSLAWSLALGSALLSLVGDDAGLGMLADQRVAVAMQEGMPVWRAQGAIYRGWVKAKNGDVTEGISLLRGGLTAYRATGAGVGIPLFAALLARACEIAGQTEEASTLLDESLLIVEKTGERRLAAELNRHKGDLLLRQGHPGAAEKLFRKALSIAGEQEAKLWELRASVSLTRLYREQGRRAEARDLLAPVYAWFTEGFGTPDLKEAKALLDELG
jgi:class 3 adenylate cyclase/predicted ATPase